MKKIYEEENFSLYEFKPSILKPFKINLEPLTLRRRIRFIKAYFTGFKVYYLKQNGNYIGYCLVQNGKDNRYKFSTSKDIIVGPYFISKNYRGKRLSVKLLDIVLHKIRLEYRFAYDYIQKENIPSIRASEAVGFEYYSDANVSRFLRRIILCEEPEGEYVVLRKKKNY